MANIHERETALPAFRHQLDMAEERAEPARVQDEVQSCFERFHRQLAERDHQIRQLQKELDSCHKELANIAKMAKHEATAPLPSEGY